MKKITKTIKTTPTINHNQKYDFQTALKLALDTCTTKFDSSLELAVRTSVDPRHADQIVRDTIILPHGTGKTLKIAAVVAEEKEAAAKKAGADIIGSKDIIENILAGKINFDILVTTPDMMRALSKTAKILGPKGLMPAPKSGTVDADIGKIITELKAGKIEFRVDKQSIIHTVFGKVSFGATKLTENFQTIYEAITNAKPTSIKGNYITSISISTSMGSGIWLDPSQL